MSLEELLSHPLLWRGPDDGSAHLATATIATGFEAFDRYLPGGGWPLVGISEIFVERYGVGELSLLMPALAALSSRAAESKQWVVWIAPPFVPYAPALLHHGVDLSRILLVHPSSGRTDALWAVEQVIRSRSSVAALAWVKQADITALRRLQLGAETSRCWTVLFRPFAAANESSPATLRVRLASAGTGFKPDRLRLDVLKCRGRRPSSIVL